MVFLTAILITIVVILGGLVTIADMHGSNFWFLRRAFWVGVILALVSFWSTVVLTAL